jgi:hypothetical protein
MERSECRRVQRLGGCPVLRDDQQSNVRNEIEYKEDDFEQPEERVNDHVKSFSGNGKPFALRAVHQIRSHYAHCDPEDQDGSVYDCAPHEESCQRLNIHDVPFLPDFTNDCMRRIQQKSRGLGLRL